MSPTQPVPNEPLVGCYRQQLCGCGLMKEVVGGDLAKGAALGDAARQGEGDLEDLVPRGKEHMNTLTSAGQHQRSVRGGGASQTTEAVLAIVGHLLSQCVRCRLEEEHRIT